jgi:hypothetical protein
MLITASEMTRQMNENNHWNILVGSNKWKKQFSGHSREGGNPVFQVF